MFSGGVFPFIFCVFLVLQSFNRFSKTYRSLKDKSSNLMQNIFEEKSEKTTNSDDKENTKNKRKSQDNPRDSMPPLTISESRRNLGEIRIKFLVDYFFLIINDFVFVFVFQVPLPVIYNQSYLNATRVASLPRRNCGCPLRT